MNDAEKVRALTDRHDFLEMDRKKLNTIKDKDKQVNNSIKRDSDQIEN